MQEKIVGLKIRMEKLKIFRQEAKFILGAVVKRQFPNINKPEFAFIGKSNVGKSSLINLLCNRTNLARVSKTPGRTKEINFFSVADKLILVDLPGYGYSKVPVFKSNNWEKLVLDYLKYRNNLKLIYILVDARRGLKYNDYVIMDLMYYFKRQYQVIFTKEDKISALQKNSLITMSKDLPYLKNKIIFTSIRSKDSVQGLQYDMLKYFE